MVTGGGYPLPPLDLKVPKAPKRRQAVAKPAQSPEPAAVAASSTPKEASDGDS
jgi:NADH-quinone oxidoreductase subunit H